MIIKFQIIKSLIKEKVQNTTYIKGQFDRTAQKAESSVVANETIGDEVFHERAFSSDFVTALETLKTIFVDYLVPTPQTIGDNAIYYNKKQDDVVEFVLQVSRRYNGTLTDTLARLSSKYVEDYCIYQWWIKTSNQKQAESYMPALQLDEQQIRKCFVLSGPIVPTVPYTKNLTVKFNDSDVSGSIEVDATKESVLSYEIDDYTVDDIEAHSENPRILGVHRSIKKHTFVLCPKFEGTTKVIIFSRHNEDVTHVLNIEIRKEADDGV